MDTNENEPDTQPNLCGPTQSHPFPTIPDMVLEEVIGAGGMGIVYLGRQPYLERRVAVKVITSAHNPASKSRFTERFRREAKLLAGLSHPNIVACHHAGATAEGNCYIVMEYIHGANLSQWIKESGPLTPAQSLQLVADLARALAYATSKGIIHRDVKSENVLLQRAAGAEDPTFPFVPKLADLGLAIPRESVAEERLTSAGLIVGTLATMSPEQINNPEDVDYRSDVYGLGCILYHCLTGEAAFSSKTVSEIIIQKTHGSPPDPCMFSSEIEPEVGELTRAMIAPDKQARPQSFEEIIERCQNLSRQERILQRIKTAGGMQAYMGAQTEEHAMPEGARTPTGPQAALGAKTPTGPRAALGSRTPTAPPFEALAPTPSSDSAARPAGGGGAMKAAVAVLGLGVVALVGALIFKSRPSARAGGPEAAPTAAAVVAAAKQPEVTVAPTPAPSPAAAVVAPPEGFKPEYAGARSLFGEDFDHRLTGWGARMGKSNWGAQEDGPGVMGAGFGWLPILVDVGGWRAEGKLEGIGKESGVWVDLKDGSAVALALQNLGGSLLVSLVALTPDAATGQIKRGIPTSPISLKAHGALAFKLTALPGRVAAEVEGQSVGEVKTSQPVVGLSLFTEGGQVAVNEIKLAPATNLP